MTPQLLITQIAVVLIGVYLAFTENKKGIYLVTFLFNLTTFIMYVLNHDRGAAISAALLSARAFVYIYREPLKARLGKPSAAIPVVFIVLHIVLGVLAIESPWQILCIVAPSLTAAYMWWGRGTQDLRAGNFLAYGMWALYEGVTGLYIVMASDIIQTVIFAVSFLINVTRGQSSGKEPNGKIKKDN